MCCLFDCHQNLERFGSDFLKCQTSWNLRSHSRHRLVVGYPTVEVRSGSDHLELSLAGSLLPFVLFQLLMDFFEDEVTPHSLYEQLAGGIAAEVVYCYGVGSH